MNKKKVFILILLLFTLVQVYSQKHTVSGYIKEAQSQELLLGATVLIVDLKTGTSANAYGFYSITIPEGEYTIEYSFVGYNTEIRKINLNKNISLDINLLVGTEIEEVVVTAKQNRKESEDVRASTISLPVQQIKEIPSFLGEKDVLKIIQLMPGVQKGTEGQSGIYVRGGGPDQNLLILDDAPVYNAQHLFGFFSVFNGDALRSVELIKAGFPARYGGRLSSIIDMNMKDGNKEHYTGELGIGLISSRAVLEGPIVKDKSSFLISGRRTYIDALIMPIVKSQTDGVEVGYYFYDLNAKVNYEINKKNKIYLSGYFGRDIFYSKDKDFDMDYRLGWGNQTGTLRWNHQFNNKLFANTSIIYSKYDFFIDLEEEYDNSKYKLKYSSGIQDIGAKIDFNYYPTPKHTVHFGLASTYHEFTPRAFVVKDDYMDEDIKSKEKIGTVESGIYIEDLYKPFNRMQILGGIRYSYYKHEGTNYNMLEPRLSASYKLFDDLALKASYAKMQQYLHLLSNTGIGFPTDLWVPSTENVEPQKAWQIAGGIAKDFSNQNLSLTVEAYYKEMDNIIGYKEGANFMLFDETSSFDEINWQKMITVGRSWSYGTEILLQRKCGKLSGWLGYTLSWTKMKFPELNFGNEYWAKYDRRHDFSAVLIYNINNKIKLGATWVYATGNAMSLPLSEYSGEVHNLTPNNNYTQDITIAEYPGRNQFRMDPYHRLDLNIQFNKKKKRGTRTWDISIYNAYNRQNPFFYYVNTNGSETKVKQVSLFSILPSFSYSFKFN